jgi:hypothetical protein
MKKINYSKVRRSAQADLKRYERLGIKIFTQALKEQAKPVVPLLPMQNAYIQFYQVRVYDVVKVHEKKTLPPWMCCMSI